MTAKQEDSRLTEEERTKIWALCQDLGFSVDVAIARVGHLVWLDRLSDALSNASDAISDMNAHDEG